MRRFRQFVAIQSPIESRDSQGGTIITWETVPGKSRVAATILPVRAEEKTSLMTAESDVRRIVLAGHHPDIRTEWAIQDGEVVFDVLSITLTLGRKATIIIAENVIP